MAARPSDSVLILKPDLANGIIQKKNHDGLLEYWIYESIRPHTLDIKGNIVFNVGESTGKIKLVVVCEDKPNHIKKEHPNHYVISGIIFSDVGTPDLTEYLQKTGRSI